MLTQSGEQFLPLLRGDVIAIAAHHVERMLGLARAETGAHPLDLAPAGIDRVVLAKADNALAPHRWLLAGHLGEKLQQNARIVFCGWIATYNDEEKRGGPKNLWQLLAKSARMEGFVVKSYVPQFPEGIAAMGQWLAEGKIVHREHVVDGLENALDAFHMLFDGRNEGKLIVRIAEDV